MLRSVGGMCKSQGRFYSFHPSSFFYLYWKPTLYSYTYTTRLREADFKCCVKVIISKHTKIWNLKSGSWKQYKLSLFLTEVSFDTAEENQLSYFQNGYFLKILWLLHEPYSRVKCCFCFQLNFLLIKFWINIFFFVSDQSILMYHITITNYYVLLRNW